MFILMILHLCTHTHIVYIQKQKSAVLRRRDEGRQLAESRKDLEDLRNKTWLQERMKAKEEERQAREAVRSCVCAWWPGSYCVECCPLDSG